MYYFRPFHGLAMKQVLYDEILNKIETTRGHRNCLQDIYKEYPDVSPKTIVSITSQYKQRKTKKSHYFHHDAHRMQQYYNTYCESTRNKQQQHVILNMADSLDICPSLLARIIVERHLAANEYNGEEPPKSVVSKLMKEPRDIKDSVLADEVTKCLFADDTYGHMTDAIKHSIGFEYEFLLKQKVEECKLAYLDEEKLRSRGYDKTPDIKLDVPIAVEDCIVNWIESKASFGDPDSHQSYLKQQYWAYWNRFGPGMVIYWFGFIDELDNNRHKGIMLMDHFPTNITYMINSNTSAEDSSTNNKESAPVV